MLRGWLRDKKGELNASTHSLDALSEPQDIEASMRAANHIMNDDLQAAEDGLANGTSSFHKMGKGMVAFLRATLGFEPEIMREASERLADAESTASADHRKAQRDSQVHRSAIYPVGSEFALCHAQAQLMSAVVGVLNESLTESIRGFYKLRKAFVTLDAILAAEDKYMRGHPRSAPSARASVDSQRSNRSARPAEVVPGSIGNDRRGKKQEKSLLDTVRQNEAQAAAKVSTNSNGPTKAEDDDDDDDDEFYDADEAHEPSQKTDTYAGHIEIDRMTEASAESSMDVEREGETQDLPPLKAFSSSHQVLDHDPDSEIFSNPIDVFIHSGANLSFGLLLVMISMIPPAFNRLLFIIGFHGDRDRGLRLLWQASKFHNINGAMAGLCLLGFYHQVISFADILPEASLTRTADNETQQDVQGYPQERCEALLQDMRTRHPKSQLWLLEQARMESMKRRLSSSLSILGSTSNTKSPLKQVEALKMFDRSLTAMFAHEYALCAESFLACVQLNNWSHTLYYYIAGAAHVEMYRHLITSGASNSKECKEHAAKATEYLHQAPKHAGKKKFMARQLPFDVFVARKVQKWDARAKEWDVLFIEAVGVSPLEEIIFFFNGCGRMDDDQLQTSLENLNWSDESYGNEKTWKKEEADEKAILAVLRAVTLRNLRRWNAAVDILEKNVLPVPVNELKGGLRDDWTAPCARYEMGVVCWMRRREGSGGARGKEQEEWVKECEEWVGKAAEWGSFELDARIGLKIATAKDTLAKFWEGRR
ncbi:MAG: hypothetical protein Q9169_004972 [Polycauliona sp. 2 TL-2023]